MLNLAFWFFLCKPETCLYYSLNSYFALLVIYISMQFLLVVPASTNSLFRTAFSNILSDFKIQHPNYDPTVKLFGLQHCIIITFYKVISNLLIFVQDFCLLIDQL